MSPRARSTEWHVVSSDGVSEGYEDGAAAGTAISRSSWLGAPRVTDGRAPVDSCANNGRTHDYGSARRGDS